VRRTFPSWEVRAAAEKMLRKHGYREPYEYINEAQVLVGDQPNCFVYCLQYKIRPRSSRVVYVVVAVDATADTDELKADFVFKRANLEFTYSELLYSLYR